MTLQPETIGDYWAWEPYGGDAGLRKQFAHNASQ
jgi:hypothetical protein